MVVVAAAAVGIASVVLLLEVVAVAVGTAREEAAVTGREHSRRVHSGRRTTAVAALAGRRTVAAGTFGARG